MRREHNRKAKWISKMGKELGLKEGAKANIYLDSFRAIIEKVPNWKMPGYDSIHRH